MNQNSKKNNLFQEENFIDDSFSVDYADTYEKEIKLDDVNLNETILESKLKRMKNEKKNISNSFTLFNQVENINEFDDELNITIQDKQNDDYLYVRKLPKYSENEFLNIKNMASRGLAQIKDYLMRIRFDLTSFDNHKKVGPLTPLTHAIESTYSFKAEYRAEMQKKYNRLKKYICNYRTIYGDGNCFYRAIIFRYIELLILYKKTEIIKRLIVDIDRSFKSDEIKRRSKIGNEIVNSNFIIQILLVILEYTENGKIEEAHLSFYKALLFSKIFDYSLILYLRFIIYTYIKQNENKLYLESFPVLIGNLLPSKYEKDGTFDFNSFYENYLLKMNLFAEKIIIYLTPFVLGININTILFDDNEDEVIKKFVFVGKGEVNIDNSIFIINRRGHYEDIFSYEDNQKYNFIYNYYRNYMKPYFITTDNCVNNNNLSNNILNPPTSTRTNYNNNIPNLYYNQFNQNTKQNEDIFNCKTVINPKSNNNLKKMYFGNQNNNVNNYNYQYNTNNNYYQNKNTNYYNNNNNYSYNGPQNQFNRIEKNIQEQNNLYLRRNSETPSIPHNNFNFYQNTSSNNNNYEKETDFHEGNNIYFFNDKNNYENYNILFSKDETIYSLAEKNIILKNHCLNNNNNMTYNMNNNNSNIINNQMNNQNYNMNNNNNINIINNQMNNQNYNMNNNNNILRREELTNYNTALLNENGKYKCIKCSTSHSGLNTIKNICYKCFYEEIINQSKYFYIEYLKNISKKGKENSITKNDFEMLFLKKIIINHDNKQYNIHQAIFELNLQQNNQFDYNKILEEIILSLKQRICLYCYCNVQNYEFQIPCGCNFCSYNHLDLFIKEKRMTPYFKCLCSYEYKPNKLLELYNFLKNKNIFKDYNYLIQKLNQLFEKICFKCGCERMVLTPVDIEGFIPLKYNHFICEDCLQNNSSNYVECSICKIQHKYLLKDF